MGAGRAWRRVGCYGLWTAVRPAAMTPPTHTHTHSPTSPIARRCFTAASAGTSQVPFVPGSLTIGPRLLLVMRTLSQRPPSPSPLQRQLGPEGWGQGVGARPCAFFHRPASQLRKRVGQMKSMGASSGCGSISSRGGGSGVAVAAVWPRAGSGRSSRIVTPVAPTLSPNPWLNPKPLARISYNPSTSPGGCCTRDPSPCTDPEAPCADPQAHGPNP